jgi:hypothetical protein
VPSRRTRRDHPDIRIATGLEHDMTLKRHSHTVDGVVFDEAEANGRGIYIEADDAEPEHPLVLAARAGRLEFDDLDDVAWAA